jgi:hypothetical protein
MHTAIHWAEFLLAFWVTWGVAGTAYLIFAVIPLHTLKWSDLLGVAAAVLFMAQLTSWWLAVDWVHAQWEKVTQWEE